MRYAFQYFPFFSFFCFFFSFLFFLSLRLSLSASESELSDLDRLRCLSLSLDLDRDLELSLLCLRCFFFLLFLCLCPSFSLIFFSSSYLLRAWSGVSLSVSELVLSMSRATSFSGSSLTKFLHSKVKCPEYPHFLQPSLGAEPWPGPPGALEAPNILSENCHI